MGRRSVLRLALCALILAAIAPARAQTAQEEVKATFVYRFASFVTWPARAFADPASPMLVCVIGADPFARTLARVSAGQRAGGRGFEVRRLAGAENIDGCQAVYVVGDRTEATLRAARTRSILTITDSVSGSERGIIHFTVVDDRVRFYIDEATAAEGGMAIDPRLLSLALAVRRRAPS